MRINVTSMVMMAKHAIPPMVAAGGGAIVNISSVSGLLGGHPSLLYPTSKTAVIGLTRSMAAHHALQGIRVNCICPGTVYTPMVASRGMTPELREARKMGTLLASRGDALGCGAGRRVPGQRCCPLDHRDRAARGRWRNSCPVAVTLPALRRRRAGRIDNGLNRTHGRGVAARADGVFGHPLPAYHANQPLAALPLHVRSWLWPSRRSTRQMTARRPGAAQWRSGGRRQPAPGGGQAGGTDRR